VWFVRVLLLFVIVITIIIVVVSLDTNRPFISKCLE
jgi:hypothetical protein